ncbi:SDR family oxidoreductase [Marinilongibacter aquaticus]|uniref:SDR family NAD(P)-dependent oxidoreductase n=1 Tax=Marinilongibacter aquaticus TaxID=2975157 RepID=UPI0021BD6083|nr:SDR family oxidoreductase [Marinilongibacter aquaticus]UBM58638.1 SDR family oxidoreductase [Marinilongibacter aquaticus]
MRLKDKVILITGSYTGIGKAIAQSCLREGAKVILNGLDHEAGLALYTEIGPEKSSMCTLDITQEGAPEKLVGLAVEKFGSLDAVVNNAALIASSNILDTDSKLFHEVLGVNLVAPMAIIRKALPALKKSKGCVLNIGSINAWGGEPNLLAYSISKGALMTLTRNLGDSLFREFGVRVNQINPGWVLTENEKLKKKEQGMKADWYRDIPDIFAPAKRIFTPEEIAAAALFLLSDESGPVSAQVMDLEQFPMIGRNLPKNWEGSHQS